jgi:nucleotide-binding universal stress UspA family protein
MKLIVSANDGSEGAERAVALAAGLAKAFNAKLLIVHVSMKIFSQRELVVLQRLGVTEGDALEEISSRIMLKAKAVAKDHGAEKIETMSAAGDPAEMLIEIGRNRNADAIVVGRRGLGKLEGLLLGSDSQKLSYLSPCAVIITP